MKKKAEIILILSICLAIIMQNGFIIYEIIKNSIDPYHIALSEIDDKNWNYGNSRSENMLLFNFSLRDQDIITHSASMLCGDEERTIINAEISDGYWIHVIYAGDRIPAREGMICLFRE